MMDSSTAATNDSGIIQEYSMIPRVSLNFLVQAVLPAQPMLGHMQYMSSHNWR